MIGLPHPLHLCEVLIQHTRLAGIYGPSGLSQRGSQARNLLCKPTCPLKREQLRERKLLAICRPFLSDPSVVQGKLCRRIERHIKELFVFVAEPAVPADNNPAERSLRHLVISRKISGGTRSEQGTERKMTLASLFGTWRAQGLNPLAACRQLLISPQL